MIDLIRYARCGFSKIFFPISGLTALHQAVLDGNFKAVRLLLKHGAEVNKLDEDHWTPLHAACAERQHNIARYVFYTES